MSIRHALPIAVGTTCAALVAGLIVGATPAVGAPTYGMVVAGVSLPEWQFNAIQFRAQSTMTQSDVVVRRTGNTVVVFEEDGGPSLGVADTTFCTASNPNGPSSEVTCTFPSASEATRWAAIGDFSNAPLGASLVIEQGSQIAANFIGSPFDDYFQGGDSPDSAEGGGGDDNLYGGGSIDVLRGGPGSDDIDGEDGNDYIYGGDDADNISGGKGLDVIVAGAGPDDVDTKDSERDVVDCGEPSTRAGAAPEAGDMLEYDPKLDLPTACNVVEWPRPLVPPSLNTLSVKVGETITGAMGEWTGTAPITYTYAFERCSKKEFVVWPPTCSVVKSGKLDARGLDGGKQPFYKSTRADTGHFLSFTVTARNLPKIGAATSSGATTTIVGPAASARILGDWLPRQVKGKWVFGNWQALEEAILRSNIGQFVDITAVPVRRVTVPVEWRKVITHDSVVELTVNGKKVSADGSVLVEAGPDERASIEIKYYSWWKDRATCPVSDQDLADINKGLSVEGMPLPLLTSLLDAYAEGCNWVIDWSNEVSSRDTFMATRIEAKETDDPDSPILLRITATKPSLRPRLNVAVSAPPQEHVSQRPDDFSIAADGLLYDFPGAVFTSIWVGLLGDQVRETGKRGVVELFMNGKRVTKESFVSATGEDAPFSTVLSTGSLEPGTARIVVSTLDKDGFAESQVFVDFTVADGTRAARGNLITWDGRCFSNLGTPATCPTLYAPGLDTMRKTVNAAINGALGTILAADQALRYASEKLDKRFVAIGANGPITPPGSTRSARSGGCWWIDPGCVFSNLFRAVAQAVTRPKSSKPKPPVQRTLRKVVIVRLGDSVIAGGVIGEGIIKIPGVGLINLDGGTLINLDGGTLINLDGGTIGPFTLEISELINLDGGTVVGTNGATIVGLNGATLVGVDPASIVGLNGATLISDMGGALVSDRGAGFSPLTLLTRT